MKTIGLVGGTGWISSAEYYKIINEETNRRLGGLEFAKCILYSLNYGEIDTFTTENNKDGIFFLLLDASLKLINAGADCIVLCANTLHQYVERLEPEIEVPVIHIAKATAKEIKRKDMKKIGLLGTKQTMEMEFYKSKLNEEQIMVLIPGKDEREFIQNTINNELVKGIFLDKSRIRFIDICNNLSRQGAEGIVLGCTEIPLLLKQGDIDIHLFNTLLIHSVSAVDFALAETE
jgi:aspartate racemase